MAMALVDRALRAEELGEDATAPGAGRGVRAGYHSTTSRRPGFVEHLKLPHYVDFQAELVVREMRTLRSRGRARAPRQDALGRRSEGCLHDDATRGRRYNFAYLDEQTKRMIRRAILKAVAMPGYQVPFASREMPMPYGWGTGGMQVTAASSVPEDTAEGHRPGRGRHHQRRLDPPLLRQGRRRRHHRRTRRGDHHPDPPPHPGNAADRGTDPGLPGADPEPLRFLEPRETETRKMHALRNTGSCT
jgi:hypothetical protein